MLRENFETAIAEAHRRLDNLLQRANLAGLQSSGPNYPGELLKEAIGEILISLEETQVLAEELQQQNEELFNNRHLIQAERLRYQHLFDFAPDGYLVTDTMGIIQEINVMAAQLLNLRQSYVIGKPLAVFIHPTERMKFRQLMLQLEQQGQIRGQELRIYHNQGRVDFPAELNALAIVDHEKKVENFRWLLRDITELHQIQQTIREQATLLDITSDAIVVQDLNYHILYWNKGAEHLYGWQTHEAQGKNAWELFFSETSPELTAAIKTVIDRGSWEGELTKINRQGKEIFVTSRWTLMRDAAGLPKSILTVDTDITEKKQLESQRLRNQRLESLGILASGIAHDLNNILTPMMTVAQLLPLKNSQLDENSQQMLKMLESNAKRGCDLVEQILSFACGSEVKRSNTISVSQMIKDIAHIIKQIFSKSIDIHTDIAPNLDYVIGDSTQLHQVLMNLAINASDAMPNGGKLLISANNLLIDQNFAKMHIGAKVGPYIVITVADNGVGIHPVIIDKIFDPFFTTKEVGKGTGLGLSTVMGITNRHGGFVEVSSELGVGSQFRVYLPSSDGSIPHLADEVKMLTGQGELILVVDDEPVITEITKTTLEFYNYRVKTCLNGIEALDLYTKHKDEISLVLMDIMMPSMAGGTAIRTLQIINPQVQIIAMSGLASAEVLARATGNGIQGFLAKPFTADELLNSVHKVLTSPSVRQ